MRFKSSGVKKFYTHVHCLLLRADQGRLVANPLLTGKVKDMLTNYYGYIHVHIYFLYNSVSFSSFSSFSDKIWSDILKKNNFVWNSLFAIKYDTLKTEGDIYVYKSVKKLLLIKIVVNCACAWQHSRWQRFIVVNRFCTINT